MQAPCCAIDAVLVTIQRHQRVVGEGSDNGALQVACEREQRALLDTDDEQDVLTLNIEIDVLADDVSPDACQQVVEAFSDATVHYRFVTAVHAPCGGVFGGMPGSLGVNGLLDFVQVNGDFDSVFHGFFVVLSYSIVGKCSTCGT